MNYTTAMIQLPLVKESSDTKAKTPQDVRDICDDLADMAQESFQVITLSAKNNVIGRTMITLGLADASLAHPREVFRPAIIENACSIILVHNHPSGDPTPSADDIRITKQLVEAGKIVDIKVLDHVIIGRGDTKHLSMREEGLIQF